MKIVLPSIHNQNSSSIGLFDSHLHLTVSQFQQYEVSRILTTAYQSGIRAVMNVAVDHDSFIASQKIAMSLAQKDGTTQSSDEECFIEWFQAAATTPHEASFDDRFFAQVEKAAHEKSIQAVGETGLDYFYEHSPKEAQRHCFCNYIDLAARLQLPLIIHCRNAFADFFSCITHEGQRKTTGVLHCFTGTKEDARQLIDMGWYISLSGIITYSKSATELQHIASYLPLSSLLIETDAPYLSPHPCRGKRNEPAFLRHTAAYIATLKGVSIDELIQTTYENAKTLFGNTSGQNVTKEDATTAKKGDSPPS